MSYLLNHVITVSAERAPSQHALVYGDQSLTFAHLEEQVTAFANGALASGLLRDERVGIYLEKRFETVVASFAAPAAGGVFVPLNPLLKDEQVAYILSDCNVRILVTSAERLALLAQVLPECHDLRHVVVVGGESAGLRIPGVEIIGWSHFLEAPRR